MSYHQNRKAKGFSICMQIRVNPGEPKFILCIPASDCQGLRRVKIEKSKEIMVQLSRLQSDEEGLGEFETLGFPDPKPE